MCTRILIVKTSSLGDVVQTLHVLTAIRRHFPDALIDWAVEAHIQSIVAAHPLVHRAIALDIKGRRGLWQGLKELRREKYDLIFDLQGNCKSGLITLLARGNTKVGYGLRSVREWPNVFATNIRFNISKKKNIRSFYLELLEKYFQIAAAEAEGVQFKVEGEEKLKVARILAQVPSALKIMVCPGSKWANKQLPPQTLIAFLQKIEDASFLLMWGDEAEKGLCQQIAPQLKSSLIVDKLPIPTWQNLMNEVDLVIALDSSALHLCGTSSTPSFSIFGPTSPIVFKPLGPQHVAIQGKCPYGARFDKQCPELRSCPTGACMKNLTAEELFAAFQNQRAFLQL